MTVNTLANVLIAVMIGAVILPVALAILSRVLGKGRTERSPGILARCATPALMGLASTGLILSYAIARGAQEEAVQACESARAAGIAEGKHEASVAAKEAQRKLEEGTARQLEAYAKRLGALEKENRELKRKLEDETVKRVALERKLSTIPDER